MMAAVRHRRMQNAESYQQVLIRLRDLRETGGYGQKDIAEALNVSRCQYTALESGRSMLNTDQLIGIAKFYGVNLSQLFEGVL